MNHYNNMLRRSPARRGNALLIAFGILVMSTAVIVATTNRAVGSLRESTGKGGELAALGAVEAVLARHEQYVVALANAGDPNAFADWWNYGTETFGDCEVRWKIEPVRSASKDADGLPIPFTTNPSPDINWEAPTAGIKDAVGADYPDPGPTEQPYWKTNDSVYLYRVSAEARLPNEAGLADASDDWTKPGTFRARAQGVRYVSVNKEPLFRYVIFYAQQGPKGDLELSHGPTINIQGNVHSNGAIYVGAGTGVNKWDAVRPRDETTDTGNGETRLGPDNWTAGAAYVKDDRVFYNGKSYTCTSNNTATTANAPGGGPWTEIKDAHIRVTGVNGIFRLCKPAMYGFFNAFPMSAPQLLPAWTPPSTVVDDNSQYGLLQTTPIDSFDGDHATISSATFNGGWVNPYRVLRDSQLVTRPLGDASPDDTARRINGTPVVGNWEAVDARGNDARDYQRPSDRAWTALSLNQPPDGFAGYARTRPTGGRTKQLPETLASRPLEAEKLFYPDVYLLSKIQKSQAITAGDLASPALAPLISGLAVNDIPSLTTPALQAFLTANRERGDMHDLAAPVFLKNDVSPAVETTRYSDVSGLSAILEVPGQYVRYAVDGTGATASYMRRIIDPAQGFIGWSITDASGTVLPLPAKCGIIIRERPVPDFNYWGVTSGGTLFSDRAGGSKNWLPYAYGKHKEPAVWPFTEMYVSNQGTGYNTPSPNPPAATMYATPTTNTNTGAGNGFVQISGSYITTSKSTQSYTVDPTDPGHITVTATSSRGGPTFSVGGKNTRTADTNAGLYRDNWRLIHLKRSNLTDATKPAADMTQASTYFSGAQFTSVQTRLLPDPATGDFILNPTTGLSLAGLMIRPVNTAATGVTNNVDLSTRGLNSRNPYVALTVSPDRGIVLQRRMTPSTVLLAVAPVSNRYYTGTNDGSGGTNALIGCTTPNQAVFRQSTRVAVTPPTYSATITSVDTGIVRTPASGYTNNGTSASYGTVSITLTKPQGEGTVSGTYTIARGPYTATTSWSASKSWTRSKSRPRTATGLPGYWDLQVYKGGTVLTNFNTSMIGSPASATWPNGWSGRAFWLSPTWGSGYSANPTASVFNGNIPAYVAPVNAANPGEGFIANDTLRFGTSWYNVSQPATLSGSNTNSKSLSPNTTTWTSSQGSSVAFTDLQQWAAASAFIGSDANLLTKLSSYGITSAVALGTPGTPPNPATDVADPAAPAWPADPTIPGQPTVPTYAGDLTFANFRDGASAYMQPVEVNSWISARGTWSTAIPFNRYQNTASNAYDRIVSSGTDDGYLPTIDPGISESLRPDYWTGPVNAAASWTGMYDPTNTTNGSIIANTTGYNNASYLNSSGTAAYRMWEDAPIPYWVTGAAYKAEVSGTTHASIVLYNKRFYQCIQNHTGSSTTRPDLAGGATYWQLADQVWLRIEKDASGYLVFKYAVGISPPANSTDWHWREIASGIDPSTGTVQRSTDNMVLDPSPTNPSAKIKVPVAPDPNAWPDTWLLGPCLQAGSNSNPATAQFADLAITTTAAAPDDVIDATDWESSVDTVYNVANTANLGGRMVDNLTKYLCSQYQVFLGPVDITEDFFSWSTTGAGTDATRIANERWFYNTREFWSQSAWWNEGDLDTSTWLPITRPNWVWKENGQPISASATATLPTNSTTATAQVEYFARTTALDINMGNLQTYLKTRSVAEASYRWHDDSSSQTATDLLKSKFSGLLYAARTNRYPRNPIPGDVNPWNPDLPNYTANATAGDLSLTDLYTQQPATPSAEAIAVRDRLVAANAIDRGTLSAPIRMQEFNHGIMISNASSINWGLNSPAVFGDSKTSIVTPNQLFIAGDLNNTMQNVRMSPTDATTVPKYTPLAVMGDSVTLLSNSWKPADWTTSNYIKPGLNVNSAKVLNRGNSTLSTLNGYTAATVTSYRSCILTNNQPTTKYRVFQGEGAPFVNTMLFMENWDGKTMNFTGSLVVLDSCRYTRSYLIDDPRCDGRSPFGLMGYHRLSTWSALTGWTGGGNPDWCCSGTTPLAFSSTSDPNGVPPVYRPPTRNMTFNNDLTTEQGTPPNTPFGVTASGVAGWSRIMR